MAGFRYVGVAAAFNLPGNALVGGGGGLALLAGLSGAFSFTGFAVATLIAVAPLPLAFALL
ncbi:MAG: hypothetical protein KI785_06920 [Devosiaceae bacterium]|nr:hypothetical protein [Devosiaceae bacterium MH13]